MQSSLDTFNEISTYTRAQAITDGILIDISNTAKEAGFKIPVAVTCSIWNDCIEWKEEDTRKQTQQDTQGRLWDVLYMLRYSISKNPNKTSFFTNCISSLATENQRKQKL